MLGSDLCTEYSYPLFEQPGPDVFQDCLICQPYPHALGKELIVMTTPT